MGASKSKMEAADNTVKAYNLDGADVSTARNDYNAEGEEINTVKHWNAHTHFYGKRRWYHYMFWMPCRYCAPKFFWFWISLMFLNFVLNFLIVTGVAGAIEKD